MLYLTMKDLANVGTRTPQREKRGCSVERRNEGEKAWACPVSHKVKKILSETGGEKVSVVPSLGGGKKRRNLGQNPLRREGPDLERKEYPWGKPGVSRSVALSLSAPAQGGRKEFRGRERWSCPASRRQELFNRKSIRSRKRNPSNQGGGKKSRPMAQQPKAKTGRGRKDRLRDRGTSAINWGGILGQRERENVGEQ